MLDETATPGQSRRRPSWWNVILLGAHNRCSTATEHELALDRAALGRRLLADSWLRWHWHFQSRSSAPAPSRHGCWPPASLDCGGWPSPGTSRSGGGASLPSSFPRTRSNWTPAARFHGTRSVQSSSIAAVSGLSSTAIRRRSWLVERSHHGLRQRMKTCWVTQPG